MTARDKLIELIDFMTHNNDSRLVVERMADYLLANGVTIPVRCKDCVCAEKIPYEENVFKCTHPQWDKSEYGVYGEDYCSIGERRADNG